MPTKPLQVAQFVTALAGYPETVMESAEPAAEKVEVHGEEVTTVVAWNEATFASVPVSANLKTIVSRELSVKGLAYHTGMFELDVY